MFIFCKVRTICFRLVHRKSKGVVITNSVIFLIQWSNQIFYKAKINQLTRHGMKRDRTLIATKRGYVEFPCYFLQSNGVKQREIQTLRKHEHAIVILHVSGGRPVFA